MKYPAVITREGRATLAEFPDCPGCQTFAEPGESIEAQAGDALVGWLETTLAAGEMPAQPSRKLRAARGARLLWIPVPARLAVKLALRWQRQAAGLSQAKLAKLAGVSQQQIAKLEDPDSNPTIETLERVAKALGAHLEIGLIPGRV
jgi:DNA-binding XRE family transcriptional regulator/predicted RNase H-like HicB family nuclease